MKTLTIHHKTVYRYSSFVTFGEHRLMFRPRDSHDLRLVNSGLGISPPASVRWFHDVFSNSIAIATFETVANELRIESRIVVDHYGMEEAEFPIEPYATYMPFSYPPEEIPDLGRTIERHYPDPKRMVDKWARQFFASSMRAETQEILIAITRAIHDRFAYLTRTDEGVQPPTETLKKGSGTCRDFALLMMEAVRSLGLAARFVTGYLYDPALDAGQGGLRGAGATHAWVQVYLPGAGWTEFDPTNGIVGGSNLIRVAVARDPSQAIPVQGTYTGLAGALTDMTVEVRVTARAGT